MPLRAPAKTVRVVLADDSALMRKKLREILESEPGIEVVACARDGAAAVAAVREFNPDVVTLDINMPAMDGITALQTIMHEAPRPVLMISSLTQEGALTTYECLELGAVDFVPKLSGTISSDIERQSREIIDKVKAAAGARVRRNRAGATPPTPAPKAERPRVAKAAAGDPAAPGTPAARVVAIGVSTGGPKTLQDVIPLLPPDLPAAVVIVQHMPESFTASFAKSLDKSSQIPVKEVEAGDVLLNGHGYVARGGKHLVFADRRPTGIMARYVSHPADVLHIPSVDVMMHSAVAAFGPNTLGVLLTGMGADGADGMVAIRKAGGPTIAEDESTCVVYGMPAVAAARGGAEFVLPCHEVADKIVSLLRRTR